MATWVTSAVVVMVLSEPRETPRHGDGSLRTLAKVHGITAGCDVLDAFGIDGARKDGRTW